MAKNRAFMFGTDARLYKATGQMSQVMNFEEGCFLWLQDLSWGSSYLCGECEMNLGPHGPIFCLDFNWKYTVG